MKKLRIGLIGLGGRGLGLCKSTIFTDFEGVELVAICDNYQPWLDRAVEYLADEKNMHPQTFTDYHEVLNKDLIDAVLIVTSWETHIPIAIDALELGIPVGMEICGCYDLQQVWDLVYTWERTKTPFMFLENCCYGQYELMLLNMVRQGVFGEVSHCDGCYAHDLRREICKGVLTHHYRWGNYVNRNCENYPTHELGPIAKMLNINRGNRFLTLTSTASKSVGMHEYIQEKHPDHEVLMNAKFNQGDVVITTIKCAGGETITLKLDTTLPRFYSRGLEVHGTKAYYNDVCKSFFFNGDEEVEEIWDWQDNWNNREKYREQYEHPIWKEYLANGIKGGHGGMDGLVYGAFFDCVMNGYDMPINVYDAAAWMAVTNLSEQSIALGGAPMVFPDFTRGSWKEKNADANPGPYHLD